MDILFIIHAPFEKSGSIEDWAIVQGDYIKPAKEVLEIDFSEINS